MSEQATDSNSADEQGDDRAAAMAEQGAAESAATEEGGAEKAGYEKAEFDDLASQPVAQGAGEANLDVILDIPVTLSMEIGRTEQRLGHTHGADGVHLHHPVELVKIDVFEPTHSR